MAVERSAAAGFRAARYAGHFALLALAFPLTWLAAGKVVRLGWLWAEAICLAGAFAGAFIVPRTTPGARLLKPGEGAANGICMYFLGLAASFLLFPAYAAGAGWAALAAGDAAAGMMGALLPGSRLGWNRDKSWAGLTAFVLAAVPACALLLWWCPAPVFLTRGGQPEYQYVWTLAVIAGISAAVLESVAFPLDDNFRIPVGTALAVWLAATFLSAGTGGMPEHRAFQPEWFLHGLGVSAVICAAVFAAGFVSLPAAVAAWLAGAVVYFFTLRSGYALLVLSAGFSMAAAALSRAMRLASGASAPSSAPAGPPLHTAGAPASTPAAPAIPAEASGPPAGASASGSAAPETPEAPSPAGQTMPRPSGSPETPGMPEAPADGLARATEPATEAGSDAGTAAGSPGTRPGSAPAGEAAAVTLPAALAFLTVPLVCAVLYSASKGHPAALVAYAGALGAAMAFAALDTASSGRFGKGAGPTAIFSPLRVAAAAAAILLFCGAAWGAGFWTAVISGHEWNAPAAGVLKASVLSAVTFVSGIAGGGAGSMALAMAGLKASASVRSMSRLAAAIVGAATAGIAGLPLPYA
ncbi:MAG: hypothetical protein N3A38_08475 [Planctomycetota bacterium]|nr:hypothetical protein [Planctomycetota bacterium]